MQSRGFASTGIEVSEIGLGAWQLGGDWGDVSDEQAEGVLDAALLSGVTFIDTADVYGSGRSEARIGRFLRKRAVGERVRVATKFGRRADPGGEANLRYEVMREHALASIERLGVERLWLTQGHCLARSALERGEVFDHLRRLQQEGLLENFGMSVESVEEAKLCLAQPGLASLQVIFNVFRQKLVEELFPHAAACGAALIVRLPLASGVLSGKMAPGQRFADADHRCYNRDGAAFNVGETFAGVPFETAVELAAELANVVPEGFTMSQWALRYCLDFPEVTTVIAGATRPQQVRENAQASGLPRLTAEQHAALRAFYRERVASQIRGPY